MAEDKNYKAFIVGLRGARRATQVLAGELKQLKRRLSPTAREVAQCSGPTCSLRSTPTAGGTLGKGGASQATPLLANLTGSLFSSLGRHAGTDLRQVARSTLGGLSRKLTGLISGSLGRLGGQLVGGLVGSGLNALVGKLFRKRQSVKVSNVVRTEVLNFPRVSDLALASNPASRLLSGRAVVRGPAVSVEVAYKGGAEDIVSAKVAQRLLDLNALQGRR